VVGCSLLFLQPKDEAFAYSGFIYDHIFLRLPTYILPHALYLIDYTYIYIYIYIVTCIDDCRHVLDW
jgi:hypothetical protein